MIEARDQMEISFSYVAGMLAVFFIGTSAPMVCFAFYSWLATLLFCLRSKSRLPVPLMFFFAGAMVFSLDCGPSLPTLDHSFFTDMIDSVPFRGEKTRALLKATLLGDRSGMDRVTTKYFRDSGASHILALSGLHLGVLYTLLSGLLFFLGRSPFGMAARVGVIIPSALIYTLATGAGPSITRAFLFIVLRELSSLLRGRHGSLALNWCWALIIQLTLFPGELESLGFQLSYLAMLGIILFNPSLKAWFPESRIWRSIAMSLSCQALTAPLIWLKFRTFPAYFLLTNLLALPLSEAMIISGLAATILNATIGCPEFLVTVTDKISGALIFVLRTISSL